jgi:hypothetical protein
MWKENCQQHIELMAAAEAILLYAKGDTKVLEKRILKFEKTEKWKRSASEIGGKLLNKEKQLLLI